MKRLDAAQIKWPVKPSKYQTTADPPYHKNSTQTTTEYTQSIELNRPTSNQETDQDDTMTPKQATCRIYLTGKLKP